VDLLQGLSGITVDQAGSVGEQTPLFLRGTHFTHTLVLVDSMWVNATTADRLVLEHSRTRSSASRLCASRAPSCAVPMPSAA
jgi:hypothetical protein